MSSKFTPEHIDEIINRESEQLKLFPADRVWENIRQELHGNPKWPALTIVFTAIILALSISTVINYPPKPIAYKQNFQQQNVSIIKANSTEPVLFTDQINTSKNNKKVFETIQANLKQQESDVTLAVNKNNELVTNAIEITQDRKPELIEKNIATTQEKTILNTPDITKTETDASYLDNINNTFETTATTAKNLNNADFKININSNEKKIKNNVDDYLNSFAYNAKPKTTKSNKWKIQMYVTPSISFRKLQDDKERVSYENAIGIQQTSGNTDVNQAVKHKPALGTELGVNFMYGLTKNFYIKAGMQFNVRQYYIDAYRDFGVATFAFVNNSKLDSVSLLSVFSNKSTGVKTELDNKLYQVSVPLGFQWDVLYKKKLGLSIGATIQPTYTLNKSVYMISTDYKYYADGTPFFRRVNFNSSANINLTYRVGNTQWFLGPQIRYQHLPTYNDVYPIKEYRMDYGLRFGFTKPL